MSQFEEGRRQGVIEGPDLLAEEVRPALGQVHRPIDDERCDVVGMGGGIRLDVLGPVALAVQRQLVHAEVEAEGVEVLDRLAGGIERQDRRVHLGLGQAGVGIGLRVR